MEYAYEQVESRNYETDISDENWELIKHLFEDKLKVFNIKYTKNKNSRHGVIAAKKIGLEIIEKECLHFSAWMNQLRQLPDKK